MSLARLLAGNSVAQAAQLPAPQPESLKSVWQQLRVKYPSDFATSSEKIAAWRAFQAEACEMQHSRFAATFHLERLLASQPKDQSLIERLARAKKPSSEP